MTINYILLTILVRAVAVLDSVVPVEVIGPRQLMSAQYDFFTLSVQVHQLACYMQYSTANTISSECTRPLGSRMHAGTFVLCAGTSLYTSS